jgi:phospholipase C
MQENHSFDNYFGTYAGADGFPADTCVPWDPDDPGAGCVKPFRIAGRPVVDLGHSEQDWLAQYNGGAMNGFLVAFEPLNHDERRRIGRRLELELC